MASPLMADTEVGDVIVPQGVRPLQIEWTMIDGKGGIPYLCAQSNGYGGCISPQETNDLFRKYKQAKENI